jgi:hypothetical protein
MVWNGIPRFFSSKNGLEWNSQGFSLPRNGSERNFKVFLLLETGGIPTELSSVPSCSVLPEVGIANIFLSPLIANPLIYFRGPLNGNPLIFILKSAKR